jgi:ribose/xylose/arabinose/galactoside ABC-type transport system permease subunit
MNEERKRFKDQPLSKQIVVIIVICMAVIGLIGVLNKTFVDIVKYKEFISSYGVSIFMPYVFVVGFGRGVKNFKSKEIEIENKE